MTRIDPGRLTARIDLLAPLDPGNAPDPHVQFDRIDTVWADVRPAQRRRIQQAGGVRPKAQITVTLRYRRDVRPGWRLVTGTTFWRILESGPAQDEAFLELLAEELDDGA